ncbi:MAG: HAD family phosphatase [Acidimicrobiales bacterium]
MQNEPIGAVVFDMGGVLVELGPLTEILGDDPLPVDEFWARWLQSPTVRAFEMGQCDVATFGDRLVAELGLSFGGAELVDRFAQWPKGLFDGAVAMMDELRGREQAPIVAVLSNTNELHWREQVDSGRIPDLFDRHYLSYRLGLAKPDADIFEHVIADLNMPAERIMFLDDNQPNVDTARRLGIDAHLTRGVTEAREALIERGLLA